MPMLSYFMGLKHLIPGHEYILRGQDKFGDLETKWCREYGTVYRIKGSLGVSFSTFVRCQLTPDGGAY